MKSLKIFLMKQIREYLFKWYEKQFTKMVEEVSITQKEHIISVIHEAEMRELPVVIELNPMTALGLANIKAGLSEEEEDVKENPFSIVKDDDE